MTEHVARLHATETERFVAEHPACAELAAAGRATMAYGVPMSWMAKWPGGFPVHATEATGAHFTCADGIEHVDLAAAQRPGRTLFG